MQEPESHAGTPPSSSKSTGAYEEPSHGLPAGAEPIEPQVVEGEDGAIEVLDDEIVYPPLITPNEATFLYNARGAGRSLPQPPVADVNLDVPFVHQLWDTPNEFDGHWACGATSSTMVLAYYGLLQPHPLNVPVPRPHQNDYGWYLSNPFTHNGKSFDARAGTPNGSAPGIYGTVLDNVPGMGWCAVWHNPARNKGVKVLMDTFLPPVGNKVAVVKASEEVAKATLKSGHPVIMSGKIFGWHHLVVIRGYYYDAGTDLHGWIINDPYGYRTDGSHDGGNVVYLWRELAPKYMYIFSGPHKPTA